MPLGKKRIKVEQKNIGSGKQEIQLGGDTKFAGYKCSL